jgi:hypothetical protein
VGVVVGWVGVGRGVGWGGARRCEPARPAAASSGLRWAATGGGGERQGRVRRSESLSGSEIGRPDARLREVVEGGCVTRVLGWWLGLGLP